MPADKKEEITFETAIARLEELTNQLESGSLSLDESLKVFEEGIRLSKYCENKLQNVEQKITVIENSDYIESAADDNTDDIRDTYEKSSTANAEESKNSKKKQSKNKKTAADDDEFSLF